jgi:hypothetical protein
MKDNKRIPVPVITGNLRLAPTKPNSLDSPSKTSLDFDLCSENYVDDTIEQSFSRPILPPVRLKGGCNNKSTKREAHGLRILPQKEFCLETLESGTGNDYAQEYGSREFIECVESFPVASLSMVSLTLSEDSVPHNVNGSTVSSFKPFRSKPLSKSIDAYHVSIQNHSRFQSPTTDCKAASINVKSAHEIQMPSDLSQVYGLDGEKRTVEFLNPSELPSPEPVPYQVHNRVLGWKLTSIKRRQDLIDILDIIHNPDDARLRLNMKNLNPHNTRKRIIENGGGKSSLQHRQCDAIEKYLSRSLKSRQSFKSTTTIKSLMEEKRRVIRSRDSAVQDKSWSDDIGESVLRRVSTPLMARSLSKTDKFGCHVDLGQIDSLVPSWIDDVPMDPTSSRAQSPLQKLYDFPVNIHKPRERMVSTE